NFVFRNVRDDVIAATNRQQEPFVYGSLSKEPIFLKSPASPEQAIAPPAAAPAPALDEIAWGIVKDSKDSATLKWFIENFPDSRLRGEAEKHMRALAAAAPSPAPAIAAPSSAAPLRPAEGRQPALTSSPKAKCFVFQGRQFCE